ncbi:hypothetical protein NL676_008853 [Syzygium grande]|nr:hypothetical protein NL676_008853 [Syzygium grande]
MLRAGPGVRIYCHPRPKIGTDSGRALSLVAACLVSHHQSQGKKGKHPCEVVGSALKATEQGTGESLPLLKANPPREGSPPLLRP